MDFDLSGIFNHKYAALIPYMSCSEAELLHFNEPDTGIFIAETANVIIRALDAGYEIESMLVEDKRLDNEAKPVFDKIEELFGKERLNTLPVYVLTHEEAVKMTGYNLARGLCAVLRRKKLQSMEEFLADKKKIAILYDVVNPTNVGAIVRTAAAMGMDGVLFTKNSVNPLTRRASRVSMGTVFQIPWTVMCDNENTEFSGIELIKQRGFKTLAMALCENSVKPDDELLKNEEKIAVVLGTEGEGLPEEIIEKCDYRVMIPMHHNVDSLNVATAAGIIFWEIQKNLTK